MAELVAKHDYESDYPREMIESELESILVSAASLVGLVTGLSRAFTTIAKGADERIRDRLVEAVGEAVADNADIGLQETEKYLHQYFSAPLLTDLLTFIVGAMQRG